MIGAVKVPIPLVVAFLWLLTRVLLLRCWLLGGDVEGLRAALAQSTALFLRYRRIPKAK